jgi:hypothetical protein
VVLGNSIYERSATAPAGFPSITPSLRGAEASGDSQRPDFGVGNVLSLKQVVTPGSAWGHVGENGPSMNLQ